MFLGLNLRTSSAEKLKINGGDDVDISSYPWQVALYKGERFFCGGVLVSPSWVLTTANCIKLHYDQNITIRAGSTSSMSGGQTIDMKRALLSDDPNFEQDGLGLIELTSPVTISTAKTAILALNGSDVSDNAIVTVIGWGLTGTSGSSYSKTLKAVNLPVVTRFYCNKVYDGKIYVNEKMFCASDSGDKSPCIGDEGGSASVGNLVVGISVNWGFSCASSSDPVVFLRISLYRDWIKAVAGI